MSNLDRTPALTTCGGTGSAAARPVAELLSGREVSLGETTRVRRLLPNLHRRLVGPWCFVDHYGPEDVVNAPGMQVPPHPHIGLQTVSWLAEGAIRHRDSLGNDQTLTAGALGLMTSGRGIAHAEHSPVPHPDYLHGLQLWVALPDTARFVNPAWDYVEELPVVAERGVTATVIMGELYQAISPGQAYSPIVGADLVIGRAADVSIPLEPDFEHALLAMEGGVEVAGVQLSVGSMLYLGCGRPELRLRSDDEARLVLLGGEPFAERIVMWWNFVARTSEEIVEAREAWMRQPAADGSPSERFGSIAGAGERLAAPPLPAGRLRPGGPAR